MQFGQIFAVQTPDFSIPPAQRIAETLEYCIASEQAGGFDTVWFPETHFSNYSYCPNPILLATAVAQHTQRIRLGLSVASLPLWHPVRLAEDLAMLDILSDGRLDVGVGKGYHHVGFRGLGVDIEERTQHFEEAIDVLVAAWTTDELSLPGPTWKNQQAVNVLPKPLQQPHPPIWMAVTSDENVRRVAKTNFHVLGSGVSTSRELGISYHELYLQERKKAGFTDDRWSYALNRHLRVLGADEDRETEWKRMIKRTRHTFRLAKRLRADTVRYDKGYLHPDPFDEEPSDEQFAEQALFGTPDEIVAKILRMNDDFDISTLIVQIDFGGAGREEILDSIRRFGGEVIPAVRAVLEPAVG